MFAWLPPWLYPIAGRRRRPRPRKLPRFCRLEVEELESRLTPSPLGILGLNTALTTDPGVQQMPSIVADPHDGQHLVVVYMDRSLVGTGYAGIGAKVSRDGGATWLQTAIPLPAGFEEGAANPIARFDDRGHVFVSFQAATFLGSKPALTNPNVFNPDLGVRERTLGFQANNGIFVARSDDGGMMWSPPAAVDSHLYDGHSVVPFDIIPDLAIDTFATLPNGQPNPNYGNLYESWSRYYPTGQFPGEPDAMGGSAIMIAVSRDGGQHWQLQLESHPAKSASPITVIFNDGAFTGRQFPQGLGVENWSHVAVGPEGDVYVSQFLGGQFVVHHSFDAGKSFAHPDSATAALYPFGLNNAVGPGPLSENQFRLQTVRAIAADPTRPGVVYVTEANQVNDAAGEIADEGEVIFARSTDYGVTWQRSFQLGSTRVAKVVNDDNDGRTAAGRPDDVADAQALPRLVTDAQGDVALIWYDTRRDPAGHLLDVFGTVSRDGGLTFSPNFRVTDQSFDADAGRFTDATGKTDFYLGDSIGLALADGTASAVWTDTRNGNQDVFFTRFSLNPLPAPANDRFEPNDTASIATDLGQVIARDLFKLATAAGDQDWFRVRTAATGSLTITAALAVPGDSVRLELYDATGTTLLATGTAVEDAGGQILGQTFRFPSASGQTYLLRVLPGPAAGSVPARYTLSVQSLSANLGTQVHGVQGGSLAPGDQAIYLLSAAAPGSLEVTVTPGANAQGHFRLKLLDSSDPDVVLASGQATGPGMHASLAVTKGQTVYLQVVGDAGARGDFTLEFTNLDQFTTPDNKTLFFPIGAGSSEAVLADVNGDGGLDVVVSHVGQDIVSVLLNNGDGTFQAPRDFAVGAFVQGGPFTLQGLQNFHRDLAVADFNRDGIPDVAVVNTSSSDLSILLGRGDGTFEPQRRVDATSAPFALDVGDLNNDGIPDLAVVDSTAGPVKAGVLLGRGDGTFQPLRPFPLTPEEPFRTNAIRIADLNHDGKNDLVVRDFLGGTVVLRGNGDGTFQLDGAIQLANGPGVAVGDVDGDGKLDVVTTQNNVGGILYTLGNGDGTFQPESGTAFSGQFPVAVAVADFASVLPNGSIVMGVPDGHPDVIVANNGRTLPTFSGPPEIVLLPGLVDAHGKFTGFGAPVHLASPRGPLDVKVNDVNGDGVLDIVAVDRDGILVIFGKQPAIPHNDTPQTARKLGTVVHIVEPTQTIVPSRTDAYYTLRVPTEAARGAGDEVLDFSGFFQAMEGAGIGMEVRDAAGNLLGTGERFRVQSAQGQALTVHVFGVQGIGGQRGAGAFTLDIDVLPQLVSVEAQPLLPGQNGAPGGPTASLVVTLQGDRLDAASAENPANFRVIWLGPDGVAGTADDQVIAVRSGSGSGNKSAVYDGSTNVNVASGNVYPTAIRQTVTLLFTDPLPAGSYQIELTPGIQSVAFNEEERTVVAAAAGLTLHPIVSRIGGQVTEGDRRTASNLVFAARALGDLAVFQTGTPFLTQLHDDLSALLDAELSRRGDSPGISGTINVQIVDRFSPALGPIGQRPVGMLVIWLDPLSPNFVDPQSSRIVYNQQDNSFVNTVSRAYVNVTGPLELIVLPIFSLRAETFSLSVANVAASVRGGVLYFGADGNQVRPLTTELRGGTTEFLLTYGSTVQSLPGSGTPAAPAAPVVPSAASPTLASVMLATTRTDSASVTALGPLFQVSQASGTSGPGIGIALASSASASLAVAGSTGLAGRSTAAADASVRQVRLLFAEVERALLELVRGMGDWLRGFAEPAPVADNPPAPPRMDETPMQQPPDEDAESPRQTDETIGTMQEDRSQGAKASAGNFVSVVGLGVCLVGLSASGPTRRRRRREHPHVEGRAHG